MSSSEGLSADMLMMIVNILRLFVNFGLLFHRLAEIILKSLTVKWDVLPGS